MEQCRSTYIVQLQKKKLVEENSCSEPSIDTYNQLICDKITVSFIEQNINVEEMLEISTLDDSNIFMICQKAVDSTLQYLKTNKRLDYQLALIEGIDANVVTASILDCANEYLPYNAPDIHLLMRDVYETITYEYS